MIDTAFDRCLQKRGSTGRLKFDKREKTLSMSFQKDNTDTCSQLSNMASLSGGERSYSTLALLLGLGEVIESPFRVAVGGESW